MNKETTRYNDLSAYLSAHFPYKVQKISLNAGFTCPNRDGTVGYGGCTYCNNQTFNPAYCKTEKTVTEITENVELREAYDALDLIKLPKLNELFVPRI